MSRHRHLFLMTLGVLIISMFTLSNQISVQHGDTDYQDEISKIETNKLSDLLTTTDTIIWETVQSTSTIDPHRNYDVSGYWISSNVYETLYTYPFDSSEPRPLIPLLAESVDISEDGLNYTFTLRQGIYFHDGTEFNATCVYYNLNRSLMIFDPAGPAWELGETLLGALPIEWAVFGYGAGSPEHKAAYNEWAEKDSIIVMNQFQVRIRLERSYAGFLSVLATPICSMISPTWIEAHGGIDFGEFNEYVDTHTCGTGPYLVEDCILGEQITLRLNEHYWRASSAQAGNPNAGSIHEVILRDNQDSVTRKLNLLLGDTDGCTWPHNDILEIWDPVTEHSINPDVSVYTDDLTYTIMGIGFNLRDQIVQSGVLKPNPFSNIDFRKACSYAFDYAGYINRAWSGLGVQARGLIPKGMFGYDDTLFQYQYDIDEAVDAWNIAMNSGLDSIFASNDYRLELYYSEISILQINLVESLEMAINAILNNERAIQPSQPLICTKVSVPHSEYLYYRDNGQLPVVMSGWAPDYDDPDDYIVPYAKSNVIYAKFTGYGNPTVDEWIDSAIETHDPLERMQYYSLIQNDLVESVAYLWSAQIANLHVESSYLHGYVFSPMRPGDGLFWTEGGPYFYDYWKELPSITSSAKNSGWWRNQFYALFSSVPGDFDETYLESLVEKISRSSDVFTDIKTCTQALGILSMDSTKGVEGLAKRELYTLWLNLAHRAFTADTQVDLGHLTEATVIREVFSECELIMTNITSPRPDMVWVVRICVEINNGRF